MTMVMLNQTGESLGPDHRHIAGQDKQRRIPIREKITCGIYRVTRAELLFLLNEDCVVRIELLKHGRSYVFALMADDDVDLLRSECSRGPGYVIDEWTTVETVEDLCKVRTHAGAESRREDQNIEHFMLFLDICHTIEFRQRAPIAMISFLYR